MVVVIVSSGWSRTQVYMDGNGRLAVHDNVMFEANSAGSRGGAVRLPFKRENDLLNL